MESAISLARTLSICNRGIRVGRSRGRRKRFAMAAAPICTGAKTGTKLHALRASTGLDVVFGVDEYGLFKRAGRTSGLKRTMSFIGWLACRRCVFLPPGGDARDLAPADKPFARASKARLHRGSGPPAPFARRDTARTVVSLFVPSESCRAPTKPAPSIFRPRRAARVYEHASIKKI